MISDITQGITKIVKEYSTLALIVTHVPKFKVSVDDTEPMHVENSLSGRCPRTCRYDTLSTVEILSYP